MVLVDPCFLSVQPPPVEADNFPSLFWFCWGFIPVKGEFSSLLSSPACSGWGIEQRRKERI